MANRRASCASGNAFKSDAMGRNAQAGAIPNGPDDERKHIAAIDMQGALRIVACRNQGAAKSQYRGRTPRRDP